MSAITNSKSLPLPGAALARSRAARGDALLFGLSLAAGAALYRLPSAPAIAIALWWNGNTIAHNFIHRPFFRSRASNRIYSIYLSLLQGFPQNWWRERHLAHHAERPVEMRLRGQAALELFLVLALWTVLLYQPGGFFWKVYLPGYLAGLGLCRLQGHFEHAGGTVSNYGALYNAFFFNDGYHVEHHRRPGLHWTDLRAERQSGTRTSRWPAVLRWIETIDCDAIDQLERLALRSPRLQRFLLATHRRALAALASSLDRPHSILIVGGGLFPRTAILLKELFPQTAITIIDADERNLAAAQRFVDGVTFEHRVFNGALNSAADLLVIPLSFRGDRGEIYRNPPCRNVLVHDWIWRRRGSGAIVSLFLLKRLNLAKERKP